MQTYDHNQTVAATTWTVNHNLASDAVAVDVFIDFNGNREKVIPQSITATDNNTITVVFSSAQTGNAHVVG